MMSNKKGIEGIEMEKLKSIWRINKSQNENNVQFLKKHEQIKS